jgi:hypothetical protein
VAPVEISHALLFRPKPNVAQAPNERQPIKIAQAADLPGTVIQDGKPDRPAAEPGMPAAAKAAPAPESTASVPDLRATVSEPATAMPASEAESKAQPAVTTTSPSAAARPDERWMATEAAPGSQDLERRKKPVSVFVSRKDSRLYVRQGMEPVFDVPVTIRDPQAPIGTHVYTAMELVDGGTAMRWTAITIPSS